MIDEMNVIKLWHWYEISCYILAGLNFLILLFLVWYYFDTIGHRNDKPAP
jgi:uncharacterized membrane protein